MAESNTSALLGGWEMACCLGVLLLAMGLACGSSSGGTTVLQSSGQVLGDEVIFHLHQSRYVLNSQTGAQEQIWWPSDLPSAVLSQPHYVAGNEIVGQNKRVFMAQTTGVLSPTAERIAYIADGALYTRRLDGLEWVLVAQGANHPVWTADGRALAYSQGDAIYRAGADGSDPQVIVTEQGGQPVAWSPTSGQLLYRAGDSWLVIGSDGHGRTPLALTPDFDLSQPPQWTADGRSLILRQVIAGRGTLARLTLASGRTTTIASWAQGEGVVAWVVSPTDGRVAFSALACQNKPNGLIPFQSYEECRYYLHLIGTDGRNPKQLGTVNSHTPPTLVWAMLRPPLTLPPAAFERRGVADKEETNTGMWTAAPIGTQVVTSGGWTAEVQEVRTGEQAVALVRQFAPKHSVLSDQIYVAVRVQVGYTEVGTAVLANPIGFRAIGGTLLTEQVTHIEERHFDPALRVPLEAGEVVEGWLLIRSRATDVAAVSLRFEPGGSVGDLRPRYLALGSP